MALLRNFNQLSTGFRYFHQSQPLNEVTDYECEYFLNPLKDVHVFNYVVMRVSQ